jgi:hypothetical protein
MRGARGAKGGAPGSAMVGIKVDTSAPGMGGPHGKGSLGSDVDNVNDERLLKFKSWRKFRN